MTQQRQRDGTCIDIPLPQDDRELGEILNELYRPKDAGEARALLESGGGPVWNEEEFCRDFIPGNYDPPYVSAIRKADQMPGTLLFIDHPRFYFSFIGSRGVTSDGTSEKSDLGTSV